MNSVNLLEEKDIERVETPYGFDCTIKTMANMEEVDFYEEGFSCFVFEQFYDPVLLMNKYTWKMMKDDF